MCSFELLLEKLIIVRFTKSKTYIITGFSQTINRVSARLKTNVFENSSVSSVRVDRPRNYSP
jgi:hypothetical protein